MENGINYFCLIWHASRADKVTCIVVRTIICSVLTARARCRRRSGWGDTTTLGEQRWPFGKTVTQDRAIEVGCPGLQIHGKTRRARSKAVDLVGNGCAGAGVRPHHGILCAGKHERRTFERAGDGEIDRIDGIDSFKFIIGTKNPNTIVLGGLSFL
jgi:hypothetical protein